MAKSEEELKSRLMKVKEESEKAGLKRNIQKTKIMASGPITSWKIDGETVETVSDFIFGGSKITVDGDCSHEIKRLLLLGRKVMTNLGGGLVTQSCLTLVTPWTIACQAPLSMGFSRQEYWSGLPFPSLGDLPNLGIEPRFLNCRQILYQLSYEGKHRHYFVLKSLSSQGYGLSSGHI